MTACPNCDLRHAVGELFVAHGDDPMHPLVDTCELESAWRAAHATPMPAGSLAYHASEPELVDEIRAMGLDPGKTVLQGCPHVCFAPTPEIAAGTMLLVRGLEEVVVMEIDVSGLDLFFELGEARHHGQALEPARFVRIVEPNPIPTTDGWSNPAHRRQHSDCLALVGCPLDRRALRDAVHVADQRYGIAHTREQYLEIAHELARARATTSQYV